MSARSFLVPIDLNKLEIRQAVAHLLASAPGSPTEGQFYYDTGQKTFSFRNASGWINLGTLDQISKAVADVDINSHKLINVSTPSASGDAATKGYVDALISGVSSWKAAVRAASTANGTLATAFVNGAVMDGVTLATGDRILLKNQTAPAENGIRVVGAGTPARPVDADAGSELLGAAVWVEEGTANADTGWVQTVDGTITIDTTGLVFVQFSGLGQVTAGAGLTKTGNTLDVGAGTGISVGADSVAIDTAVVVRKFAVDVGDGASTSITLTHNLGTLDVIVSVAVKGAGGAEVECDVVKATTNTVTLNFAVAPTSAQYRAVVFG